MQEVAFEGALDIMLDSLLNGRLVLLAGAGLSIPPPTKLPSAAAIAHGAKQKFDATYGETRPPLSPDIEEQANYFFDRGELDTVYFGRLVDQHAFCGPPNSGHDAAADLLLVRAFRSAVTTNVDAIIETAGSILFGEIAAVIDGQAAAALPDDVSPLLKIHGCRVRDRANMIWAPGQLTSEPVQSRIAHSKTWLTNNLVNRDILIVGFWTDWDYLNAVLAETLDAVNPSRVIVVSPAPTDSFQEKAPELFALGRRSQIAFQHARVSGDHFLNELRRVFSMAFVRRVLHSGAQEFELQTSTAPDPVWLEPPDLDCEALWRMRRDLEGCLPSEPAKVREPPTGEALVGLTLLQLRAAGAVADGTYWQINNHRVRVVRASNKALHRVKEEFTRELAPAVAPDFAIAVGAEELSLAANIARPEPSASGARGQKERWLTRPEAVEILGL